MSYAQPSDVISRYPNRDLVQLTNEDPSQQTVNTAFLQTHLNDASVEIDSYLEARFSLPLTDAPAVLTRLCCDIALYRMQSLRPLHDLEDARKRYDDAVAMLTKVAKGELTLGLANDGVEPADPTSPAVATTNAGGDATGILPQRIFNRGNLKGF
jgi:phage gp36-like protein